jgi:hypothetical protein
MRMAFMIISRYFGSRLWTASLAGRDGDATSPFFFFFFFFFVIFFFSCIARLCSLLKCSFLFVRFTLSFVGWRFCVVKCKVDGRSLQNR